MSHSGPTSQQPKNRLSLEVLDALGVFRTSKVMLQALWRSFEPELSVKPAYYWCFWWSNNNLLVLPSLIPSLLLLSYRTDSQLSQEVRTVLEKHLTSKWFLETSQAVFYMVIHQDSFHPQVVSVWGTRRLWFQPWHLLVQLDLCDTPKFTNKCQWF